MPQNHPNDETVAFFMNRNFYTKLPDKPNMLQILPDQEEILLHLADHLSTMAIYAAEKQAGISVPESSVWKSSSVSDIFPTVIPVLIFLFP